MNRFLGFLAILVASRSVFAAEPLLVVVMDPLSKELACECVKGYAQRNYWKLAAHLQQRIGTRVDVVHGNTIADAVKDSGRTPGLIVGKSSVVIAQSKLSKIEVTPVARLTGKDGSPDQFGLIVVRKDSKANQLADLSGYRVLFGPADCDEKSSAPIELLKSANIEIPAKLETIQSCASAAEALMQLGAGVNAAAVISSYAEPLLEGCGTIEKGDIRVVAKTKNVPFITAFANKSLPPEQVKLVTDALLDTGAEPELLKAMESLIGFIELDAEKAPVKSGAWNQFRGPNRDGVAPWLPESLPAKASFAWDIALPSDGVGGIAATDKFVIASGRDSIDRADFFFAPMR